MVGYMFVVIFCPFNMECNRGLRSMIFYDELVILECESRHSFSTNVLVTQISMEPRLLLLDSDSEEVDESSNITCAYSIIFLTLLL